MSFIRVKCLRERERERERERDVASRLRCAHDRERRTEKSERSGEDVYDYVWQKSHNITSPSKSECGGHCHVRLFIIRDIYHSRSQLSSGNSISQWDSGRGITAGWIRLQVLLRHACGGCNHLVTEVAA